MDTIQQFKNTAVRAGKGNDQMVVMVVLIACILCHSRVQ